MGIEQNANLIRINNQDVIALEYKGQRVVTFDMVDQVHERPVGTAKRNFAANRKRMIEGEDFYRVDSKELNEIRTMESGYTPQGVILLTESGYCMLVKSFRDDLAWQVQRSLVNGYFRQEHRIEVLPTVINPTTKMMIETLVRMDEMEQRQIEQEKALREAERMAMMAFQGQQWVTIRQYVAMHNLQHQMPIKPMQQQYGRWLTGYCSENNLPVYEMKSKEGWTENTYPIWAIQQTIGPWLMRREGQGKITGLQIEEAGVAYGNGKGRRVRG